MVLSVGVHIMMRLHVKKQGTAGAGYNLPSGKINFAQATIFFNRQYSKKKQCKEDRCLHRKCEYEYFDVRKMAGGLALRLRAAKRECRRKNSGRRGSCAGGPRAQKMLEIQKKFV
jgi:hypothetical protein